MTNQKKISQYQHSGFTLIEIIVVLLITSILLFVTTNFLQNLQKISIRSSPNAENTQEIILFKKILHQDLLSFIPTNTISENYEVIKNGKKISFSAIYLDTNAEEQARHITWEIKDQAVSRKITPDLQSDDFTETHSFETLGEELVFELFYQKKWYQDFTPTKLFFRPESVMLKEPKGNSLAVINVH